MGHNIKVRLRFGGEHFPPTILFKVFVKRQNIVTIDHPVDQVALDSRIVKQIKKQGPNHHNEWRKVGHESEFGKVLWTVILDPNARIRDGNSWKPTVNLKRRKNHNQTSKRPMPNEPNTLAKYVSNISLRSKASSIRSARSKKLRMLRHLYGLSSAEADDVTDKILQGPPDNGESLEDLLSWCDDLDADDDNSEFGDEHHDGGEEAEGDRQRNGDENSAPLDEERAQDQRQDADVYADESNDRDKDEIDDSVEKLEDLLYDLEPPSP